MMWLFAGFSAWLTEEAADGTDAFTLLFSFLPRSVSHRTTSTPRSTIRFLSVHQWRGRGEEGEEVGCSDQWQETRRWEGKT